MELKDFIKETLLSTLQGVHEAQEEFAGRPSKGSINPTWNSEDLWHQHTQNIEFDIAVTATKSTAGKAGGGIKVMSIGAGASIEDTTQNSSVSRIKFTIPVLPPVQPVVVR
jgi:hypothetical protein